VTVELFVQSVGLRCKLTALRRKMFVFASRCISDGQTVDHRELTGVFSERDTYVHVRYMLSAVRLSVVCLSSVVCNVGAPYSAG